ncbi:SIR2 family protein [Hymenobacter psoromatis]|uniref:SIR2 family protein n=1 Tax=Hymenobacter psoromatis TaxID=1484116 RepID=UPI001CBD804E|nr:SIR2 family protein [Hymenobacter psoromatis]
MTQDQASFIRKFVEHLFEGDTAIFAGAGFSVPAGYVNWSELLRDIADELRLDIDQETDLITVAQYHHTQRGRHAINHKIVAEFSEEARESENHRILTRLPISTIWTTNYDRVIEDTYSKNKKRPDVKYRNDHFSVNKSRRDVIVYKMHGDVEDADNAVITKYDYQNYNVTHQPFITALSGDLVTKTFLFLGFSFTDPNLDYILSRVRRDYGPNTKNHYCIFKRVKLGDKGSETEKQFTYNTIKQELLLEELRRSYRIFAVLIDDYPEITVMLAEIETQYKQRTIFISGSAATYAPHTPEQGVGFTHNLAKSLIQKNYTVVNGFGLGIGSAVINGALEAIYDEPTKYSEDQLVLRPFPQFATGEKTLGDLWQEYRQKMISYAGIAIFIFGNKEVSGETVNAPGVLAEYDIAVSKGLFILPIGATGYQAKVIWDRVKESYNDHSATFLAELEKLQDETQPLDALLTTITKVLTLINKK